MPITQHFDRLLFGATIVLTAVGLAVMGSASWVLATERYGRSASYFVTWQSATAAVGLLLMLVVMHLKTEVVLRPKVTGTFLALSWLLLLGAYLQPPINATHRWLSLGSISVQPSVVLPVGRRRTLRLPSVSYSRRASEKRGFIVLSALTHSEVVSATPVTSKMLGCERLDVGARTAAAGSSGLLYLRLWRRCCRCQSATSCPASYCS